MAFTDITQAGLDWQDKAFCNEFRRAHSERSQAIGGSSVSWVFRGEDIQAVAFWKTFQDWLEDNCDSYVDYGATIAGEDDIPYYTPETWRYRAGIHEDGFRRATEWVPGRVDGTWENDVTFSYGVMLAGDIIGPWIFDDLQKGFDALRWTCRLRGYGTEIDSAMQFVTSTEHSNCNDAYAEVQSNWVNGSWPLIGEAAGADYVYRAHAGLVGGGFSWWAWAKRTRGKSECTNIPTHRPSSCTLYQHPAVDTDGHGYDWGDIDMVVHDPDHQENKLWFWEEWNSGGESSDATRESTLYDPVGVTCPLDYLNCSFSTGRVGHWTMVTQWVFKWNFEFSLPE